MLKEAHADPIAAEILFAFSAERLKWIAGTMGIKSSGLALQSLRII